MNKSKIILLKSLLAEFLGVDPEDLSYEDSLGADLHMQAQEVADFVQNIASAGFDTSKIDLTKLETLGDLIEALELEDEI